MTDNLGTIALGFIGATLLALIASRRPTFALALWVTSGVALAQYMLIPGSTTLHVHLIHLLLAGLLIGFGVGWAPASAPGRLELLMLAFMAWAIVSGCISGTIFREDGAENIRVLLSGFIIPALILYLARSTRQSPMSLRAACGALTVLLGYLIVTAFAEHFRIRWLVFPQYILDPSIGIHAEKARGPVLNGAENGGIMAILLLVALHRLRYAFTPSVRWLATFALLLTGIPALWFTQERGPWVAFAGGLLIMLFHEPRRGVVSALAAIAAVAIPVVIWLHIEVVPRRQGTIDFRIGLYRESLAAFKEHPITGWGTGTFTNTKHLFDTRHRSTSLSQNVEHDTIVAMASDTGAIGALLYVSFLLGLFRSLVKLRRSARSPEGRDFTVTCLAVLTTFVINGVFADARFWMPQNALVFFLAGLALAFRPNVSRKPARALGFAGSPSMYAGGACVCASHSPWLSSANALRRRFPQQLANAGRSGPRWE
jgi:O-antigen ligase